MSAPVVEPLFPALAAQLAIPPFPNDHVMAIRVVSAFLLHHMPDLKFRLRPEKIKEHLSPSLIFARMNSCIFGSGAQ